MEVETAVYEDAMRRIFRGMKWLACAGALAGLCFRDWRWALAFFLGAAASYLNFSWLHQAVDALGQGVRPTPKGLLVFLMLRYVLLGAAGYVIVKVFGMNALAALSGLFVPIAAIFLEVFYELTHLWNMKSG